MKPASAAGAPRAVLFDLDGTLLDTAEDIALALGQALAEQQLPPLDTEVVRQLIGRGVPTLIQRAVQRLGSRASGADAPRLLERFHVHYRHFSSPTEIRTRVYPGVITGLTALKAGALQLGVVTNKPQAAALGLLRHFYLIDWIDVLIGGDTGLPQKPDPAPLLQACQELGVQPGQAVMVGDSLNDVLAARAAGMPVVCVPYGYNEGNDPRALPCDAMVETLEELPGLLASVPFGAGARPPVRTDAP
jgi:phosphoglycolate phosphatase